MLSRASVRFELLQNLHPLLACLRATHTHTPLRGALVTLRCAQALRYDCPWGEDAVAPGRVEAERAQSLGRMRLRTTCWY